MFRIPRRFLVTAIFFVGLLGLSPGRVCGQNLLKNGDFDLDGAFTITNGYAAVGSGNNVIGWTTISGNAANANVYVSSKNSGATWIPNPEHGRYSIQLDSTSNDALGTITSSIAQTVIVTAGQSYLLSFWYNTEVKNNLQSILQTTLSGAYSFSTTYFATASSNVTQANAVWVHVNEAFTASTTGALTITFTDISTSDSNASIDNVSLTTVPEPATYIAGTFALGLIGWRLRVRRAARAALCPVAVE